MELPYSLPDTSTPNKVPWTSRDMRNELDFPSAPQQINRKQYPLRNRSKPKTIEKHSGVTKIIEVTNL